jgi:hypothetical protein
MGPATTAAATAAIPAGGAAGRDGLRRAAGARLLHLLAELRDALVAVALVLRVGLHLRAAL